MKNEVLVYNKHVEEEGILYFVPYIISESKDGVCFPGQREDIWLPKSQIHLKIETDIISLWISTWLINRDTRTEELIKMAVLNENKQAKRDGSVYRVKGIEAETQKAYGFPLVTEDVLWLPKSQIHVVKEKAVWFYIPKWLEEKKKSDLINLET